MSHDLQRLFAGVGLGHQQVVKIDAELVGVGRVQRVLGVDEGGGAAGLLHLGHDVQRQGGFAGAFRPVDLDHPPLGQAADAERDIQTQRSGRVGLHDIAGALLTQLHHRPLAEGPVDLRKRRFQGLLFVCVVSRHEFQSRLCHLDAPLFHDSGSVLAPGPC